MVWKFSLVRVIGDQFAPREPKQVREFRESRVREIGGEITGLEWSKFNGKKVWFDISEGSGKRGFHVAQLVVWTFYSKWCDHKQKFANILMLLIFAVFVQPLTRISYWRCFHNCGRLEASSLAYRDCNFCAGRTTVENIKSELNWIDFLRVANRLRWSLETTSICIESTCIETTLYRNDRERNGTFIH